MPTYRITKVWVVDAKDQDEAEYLVDTNQCGEIVYEIEDEEKYQNLMRLSKKASQGDTQAAIDLLKAMSE